MIVNKNEASKEIYTVVKVFRGLAEATYSFRNLEYAERCLRKLKKDFNPDDSDVQIFENKII